MTMRHALPILLIFAATACRSADPPVSASAASASSTRTRPVHHPAEATTEMIDDLQKRTFLWFWETTNDLGLVHDRWPTETFSS
ncbi:MAG TPA: Tat pathway signal protein, partial [Thermoanaerobaculia bacterium]|nr:Tat pathway signal protein [Thermoanaerobaculia bacterium]